MSALSDPHQTSVLFARQPIFDGSREIVAFELLFRPTDGGPMPLPFDGNRATSTVLLNAFTQGDLNTVGQGKHLYVNFTADTLAGDIPFDNTHLVVEILEDTPCTEAVCRRLIELRKAGYTLALDDFTEHDATHPFLPLVDIVKLEYPHYSNNELYWVIGLLRRHHPHLKLLAEKLETEAELEQCLDAGCDYFQGYFLARPQIVHGKPVTTARLTILKLITELNQPEVSTRDVATTIERDPALGVRLLRLVNTTLYQRAGQITSLHQAVTLIGTQRIRSLATLLALSELDDKPHSLRQLALARASLCRELTLDDPLLSERAFIVGLFSYLEAFFDRPLKDLVAILPLHASINAALLQHEGPLGALLDTAIKLEHGDWNEIPWGRLRELGIQPTDVSAANQRALHIVGELTTSDGF
ncbi:HDOD domain-containing protein [Salinicola endophyticus]|uniref:HDOD domain-containing protein n=1 Tax=Salinicola endophyticus TaxID=1949083 RepID=A0ABY8FHR7_9GAMM|nr:HDOD domain-containing protein [Salinicola endophyticus]WFF42348.1 HDOD domain-containing protein [Salinicola endophyticus]